MSLRLISKLSIALLPVFAVSSAASAALVAGSDFNYFTPQTVFNLTPGQSVVVPIYLKETVPSEGTSTLQSQQGLAVGTFRASANSEFLPVQATAVVPAPGFQTASYTIPFPSYSVTYPLNSPNPSTTSPAPTSGVLPTQFVPGSSEYYVLLQNMTFTASQQGSVTYSIGDPFEGPQTSTFLLSYVFGLNSPIDPIAGTSVTFNVAVPEPTGLLPLGAVAAMLVRRRRT